MILHQFYLNCLAHASYIVGDERTRIAVVVDPQRDIDQYLTFAESHDLRIAHVVLTHLHADFIAGHLELRDRVGATIYLGARAQAEYAFTPLHDGERVEFGRVRLQAIETPGHTPESISLAVYDLDRSEAEPYAVLTGDTLFVGDVGRPDLRAALGWSATELGGLLYDSLRTKLLTLPDASLVYPAHGAGSLCGKALGKETVSTIGEQRRVNYALQPMSKTAFVDFVTADQPDAPAYFTYDAVLNSKERPTLDQALARELNPMTLELVLAVQRTGGQILDTRDPTEFAAAHLAGSINIGLCGQYATWAGTLLDRASDRDHRGPRTRRRSRDPPRAHRLRSHRRLSAGRHAQPRVAAGPDGDDRANQRAAGSRASGNGRAARGRRAHVGRTRAEERRRELGHPVEPPERTVTGFAEGSAAARLLRGWIPVVDCREPAAAARPLGCVGNRRRHCRMGSCVPACRTRRGFELIRPHATRLRRTRSMPR
jgi:glyoxylase-like metal-dependent hydrolase (beta-lactamase superfamily II)